MAYPFERTTDMTSMVSTRGQKLVPVVEGIIVERPQFGPRRALASYHVHHALPYSLAMSSNKARGTSEPMSSLAGTAGEGVSSSA